MIEKNDAREQTPKWVSLVYASVSKGYPTYNHQPCFNSTPSTPPLYPNVFPSLSSVDTHIAKTMPSQQVFNTKDGALYTASNGAPVAEPYAAEKLTTIGPLLLQGESPNSLRLVLLLIRLNSPT